MDQFAPSWMPRSQRRHINRALGKLFRRNACSICGKAFEHNSPTAPGLDTHGTVVLAGECCASQVAQIFGMGLYQSTGTGTDKIVDDMMRRGGGMPITPQSTCPTSPGRMTTATGSNATNNARTVSVCRFPARPTRRRSMSGVGMRNSSWCGRSSPPCG